MDENNVQENAAEEVVTPAEEVAQEAAPAEEAPAEEVASEEAPAEGLEDATSEEDEAVA